MGFFADFHIHSRYSRGTSPALELPELARWAGIKGIGVVGSGDFTHPLWFRSLKDSLSETAPGLYSLEKNKPTVHFILSSEISLIYKQGGRVRKVHLLLLAPSLAAVEKINAALGRRYNLNADGRPILGISAREISAEILAIDDRVLIIPAHIWTPWFSLLGSRSGFDSLEECFAEVTPVHPCRGDRPVGRSAHAGPRGVAAALHDPVQFRRPFGREPGTRGQRVRLPLDLCRHRPGHPRKHHRPHHRVLPGSRENTIMTATASAAYPWLPKQTRALGGICPVCGKPLTLGVLYRAGELADREAENRVPFTYQVPLRQILSQVLQCGETSQKVSRRYFSLIERLGPEFTILQDTPIPALAAEDEKLAAAIRAMRENRVRRQPGYDGVYGRITLET